MQEVKLQITDLGGFFADAIEAARRIDGGDFSVQQSVVAFESMETLLKTLPVRRWRPIPALKDRN
ncbi:hypothetical protein [Rhizobium sp.]|uniref:hypothetical protein n=1 Tax=Rhizobium sp. TaxID=391 RepID=UPI000DBA90CA